MNINDNDEPNKYNNGCGAASFLRSISVPSSNGSTVNATADTANATAAPVGSKVSVHRADDDETFASFFATTRTTNTKPLANAADQEAAVQIADFDAITTTTKRLVQKRTVQGPRNRRATANPLKTLAARQDLQTEYTEIRTGIADKELRRMKLETSEFCLCFAYLLL